MSNAKIFLFGNNDNMLLLFDFLLLVLLLICMSYMIASTLLKSKVLRNDFLKYLIPLLIIIVMKLTVYFFVSPAVFLPSRLFDINNSVVVSISFGEIRIFLTILLAMVVMTVGLNSLHSVRYVVYAFGIGCALSSLIPLILFPEMIGSRIVFYGGVEYLGGFWNSSLISFISVNWLLVAWLGETSNKLHRIFLTVLIIVITIGAFMGLSRSIFLATLLAVIAYIIYSKKIKVLAKAIVILIVFIALFNLLFPNVWVDSNARLARLDTISSITEEERFVIWNDYISNISEYGLLGQPIFGQNYRKYHILGMGPHSVILNWWTQFGIISVLAFFYLLTGLFKSAIIVKYYFSKKQSYALFAWIINYLSVAMFNQTGFNDLTIFFAFGIILAWGKCAMLERRGETNEKDSYFYQNVV